MSLSHCHVKSPILSLAFEKSKYKVIQKDPLTNTTDLYDEFW